MKQSTNELQDELTKLLDWFESDEFDIDEAAQKYKRGQDIIKELHARLQKAENSIKKLNVSLD